MPMSDISISDANEALANFIWGIVEDSSAKNLISSREQIVFSAPKPGKAGTKKISVFMFNTTVGAEAGALEFHYLVTPFTGNDDSDRELIDRIIRGSQGALKVGGENAHDLVLKVNSLSLDELTKLWTALGTPLRLSAYLTVSSSIQNQAAAASATVQATVDANAMRLYRPVLETFMEQSEGWKKRNMVFRQWTLGDFKKHTSMSADEMQETLAELGDKLRAGASSTMKFLGPLKALAEFYEYQLGEMKGFNRVRNQKENIELIEGWVRDVKALIEALTK